LKNSVFISFRKLIPLFTQVIFILPLISEVYL